MRKSDLSRRDFGKLTTAALGGMVAGAVVGCEKQKQPAAPATPADGGEGSGDKGDGDAGGGGAALLLEDLHVCRGLNVCMNKGASEDNACAGQGTCATAQKHTCHASNACKGQGGCGANPGENACSSKGKCNVPLGEKAWKAARANFEKAFNKKNGKDPGAAPEDA